jgi:hypothetical protein
VLILCALWIPIAFIPWIAYLRFQQITAQSRWERQKREIWLEKGEGGEGGLKRSRKFGGITAGMFDRAAKGFLFFLGFLAIGISFSKSELRIKVVSMGASVFEL